MYNMKIIGPKIDPCGTPHSILKKDDEVLFIDTNTKNRLYYEQHVSSLSCCTPVLPGYSVRHRIIDEYVLSYPYHHHCHH